jgi:hypothetical protein
MNAKLVYHAKLYESETMLHLFEGNGIYFIEINNIHHVFRKKIAIAN